MFIFPIFCFIGQSVHVKRIARYFLNELVFFVSARNMHLCVCMCVWVCAVACRRAHHM